MLPAPHITERNFAPMPPNAAGEEVAILIRCNCGSAPHPQPRLGSAHTRGLWCGSGLAQISGFTMNLYRFTANLYRICTDSLLICGRICTDLPQMPIINSRILATS